MKNIVIAVLLVAVGVAGTLLYMQNRQRNASPAQPPEDTHQRLAAAAKDTSPCAKHNIPKSLCAFCDPSLIESLGFCRGHGVPEAFCTRCSPAIIPAFQVENDWCAEHNLPESQCEICNPKSSGDDRESAQAPPGPAREIELVAMKDMPRTDRPPSPICQTERTMVRLADGSVAERAGLRIDPVRRREVSLSVRCNAELEFNGDRFAHVSPRAPGVVHEVNGQLGRRVSAGEVLAIINSHELGTAKAELLQNHSAEILWRKNYEQQRELADSGVKSQRDALEAETRWRETAIAVARAIQQLRHFGFDESGIEEIQKANDTSPLLAVTAPFDGMIVDRHAVLGEVIDTAHALFAIADTSTMWAMLDVPESDAASIALGQEAVIALTSAPDQPVIGRIAWISPRVDPRTRTLQARAEVANPDGTLRANAFGSAEILVHQREPLVVIPREAVQWDGCCNIAFVQKSATEFAPRKLRLGGAVGDWLIVKNGLEPDEPIVTQGSFLLKTEILKGSIGAGCCAHDVASNSGSKSSGGR